MARALLDRLIIESMNCRFPCRIGRSRAVNLNAALRGKKLLVPEAVKGDIIEQTGFALHEGVLDRNKK